MSRIAAYALLVGALVFPCSLTIADDAPLPKSLTPFERTLPQPHPESGVVFAAPTGVVRCPAEYELAEGLFIAWDGFSGVLTDLTVAITNQDPNAVVYIAVDTTSERSSVQNSLAVAGADLSQVEFLVTTTNSVWMRDYGPRYIFEDGVRTIVDHTYNRPRPSDNQFPDFVAAIWAEPQYDIPLTHGGGNFHLFSNGDAFMSDLILAENSGLTEQDVVDLYAAYQGVNLTIYPGFPTWFDSTQHIDMWMLPIGDDQVVIGSYAPGDGTPYTITENAASDLAARGYTVYRTPGWNSGGTHYTYTNGVILNDLMLIPKFYDAARDAEAKAVFEAALPDHTVIQVDCSSIIHSAGAIHCIVMHVPSPSAAPFVVAGDVNCDGLVNFGDIDPFVLALTDAGGYVDMYPDCALATADCNDDALVNFADIDPFVALLMQ